MQRWIKSGMKYGTFMEFIWTGCTFYVPTRKILVVEGHFLGIKTVNHAIFLFKRDLIQWLKFKKITKGIFWRFSPYYRQKINLLSIFMLKFPMIGFILTCTYMKRYFQHQQLKTARRKGLFHILLFYLAWQACSCSTQQKKDRIKRFKSSVSS